MARSYDWSPLRRSNDPVPGDPEAVLDAAERLARTASALQAAHDGIKRVASGDASSLGRDSEALDAFREVADSVGDQLVKAKPRYEVAARALREYHHDLAAAQRQSLQALRDAESAESARARELAHPPEEPLPPGQRTPAETALDAALGRLAEAVAQRDTAAEAAARRIENKIEHDEVKDSFWDNMSKVADVLSNISTVLGVLALVVNIIPVIGQALSAVLGILALVTGALALVLHLGAALDNGQGWDAVVFDAIGVATFGVGRVLMAGAKGAGLAARTTAWSKLSRVGGPTASRLSSGTYAFASKGPMTKGAAAAVVRTGPLSGRNPLAVALGPRGLAADLRVAWSTVRSAGWGGAWTHVRAVPDRVLSPQALGVLRDPGDLARAAQGEAGLTQVLDDVARLDDFAMPQLSQALDLVRVAETWSMWSHVSFGVGVAGTVADNAGVDLPVLP